VEVHSHASYTFLHTLGAALLQQALHSKKPTPAAECQEALCAVHVQLHTVAKAAIGAIEWGIDVMADLLYYGCKAIFEVSRWCAIHIQVSYVCNLEDVTPFTSWY
jgi:hypothetical protein